MEDRVLTLRDGTRIHIRRLLPTDAGRLQEGVARLSDESRIQRFHAGLSRLSATQLRYLTEVDQVHHLAWGAEDLDAPEDPGVAVVRAIELPDRPGFAEFAVTVVDAYQGRGLGTLLLGLIALDAQDRGYHTLVGTVRLANEPMLRLMSALGATEHPASGPTVEVWLSLALESWPDSLPVAAIRGALHDFPGQERSG